MKRPLTAMAYTSLAMMSAEAMVSSGTASGRTTISPVRNSLSSLQTPQLKTFTRPSQVVDRSRSAPFYHQEEEEEWEDEDMMEMEVHSFQELQRSAGTEILDSELQFQIDQAYEYPNLFLDAHVSDASYMEKVAMASIPEQLPRPALDALRKTSSTSSRGLNFASVRVSPDEDIQLARMIQEGVQLHRLRSDFESTQGRSPSRAEWAQIAGLDSAKQLRRQVANYRKAKQLLVSANIGLVHAVVRAQCRKMKTSGLTFEELVQEGSLGLLRAAELFDPERGLRFSTYATIWIKGQLSNSHVVEPVKLPQREKVKWVKINKAHTELMEQNGGIAEPTVEELANHLGMTVSDVVATKRKMMQVSRVLSLDYEYTTQSRSGVESSSFKMEHDQNFMADADLAERTQMHADVVAAMARNLSAREARLMRLRYGLADGRQRSLVQCAEAMGISESSAQNLASKCMKKLREASEAESLQEYLLTIA